MNRTNMILAMIAVAAIWAAGSAQTNRTPIQARTEQAGRYQLLAAEHEASTRNNESFVQKDLFRIDTATGETSFYSVGFDRDGKAYVQWTPIK